MIYIKCKRIIQLIREIKNISSLSIVNKRINDGLIEREIKRSIILNCLMINYKFRLE